MSMENFAFDPVNGIENQSSFPTTPVNEAAARAQFQTLFDQLRDFINEGIVAKLSSTSQDNSGAANIGSNVAGLSGTNVHANIQALKAICDYLVAGVRPGEYVTDTLLASDIKIGSLAQLSTVEKGNVVSAVNEALGSIKANVDVITQSGIYTVPASGTYKVTVIGGGAGGCVMAFNSNDTSGINESPSYFAPGGASGGTAIKWLTLTKDAEIAVTVGSGGVGGVLPASTIYNYLYPGGAGGTSSFGTYCSATGGGAFIEAMLLNQYDRGIPGKGYDGDINLWGERADMVPGKYLDKNYPVHNGMRGGDTPYGVGGYRHYFSKLMSSRQPLDGIDGSGFGAGGGGSMSTQLGSAAKGGAGTSGAVIVEYVGYIPPSGS